MRNVHTTLAFVGLLVAAGFGQVVGCAVNPDDCSKNNECFENGKPYGSVVGPPPGCTDSPKNNRDVITNECGYFVSANGDDANAGTAEKPFKTLGKAIDAARSAKARVYACADGAYAERVELPGGVSVFGGFSCTNGAWNYDATPGATIQPAAPGPDDVQASLRVTGKGTSQLEDLVVRAPDATLAGGSAIAVIVDGVTVDFARTDLIAGNGAAGAQGTTPADNIGPANPEDSAIKGNSGPIACMGGPQGNDGGAAKDNMFCPGLVGGKGGNGQSEAAGGDNGADGQPLPMPNPMNYGVGGLGETMAAQCSSGEDGLNGKSGNPGSGAQEDGSLDATRGYIGASGGAGSKGTPGQGGGGGGGSKGKSNCYGAGGGSGGAGGCPGNGGLGGAAGGSSIGIVSIGGTLRFDAVDITTSMGGNGGAGGDGQFGGAGGTGGTGGAASMGVTKACNGGAGGQGGDGGTGGGGRGGHSIGIAHKGGTVSEMGVTIVNGAPGAGGNGGNAAAGMNSMVQAFP
ncbi:hypothetical protein [Polyangium sp. 6x1]|uniref:hypothetical protein n=1 Tax=Polyangium sp. 6x1 TaxID=3042689 RepID=UPI00248283E1|nr:hypothetical protein [Polyangium sp. 6x1]MDI1447196.1 hypothetical protein [Polyangium sp. 6x1]